MPTLKDVAKIAGVSPSTVSIVVNNQAKQRKIPQSTIDKVNRAVRQLGYQPNRNARQLRLPNRAEREIAFYWPVDQPTSALAALLMDMQTTLRQRQLNWRLIVQTYQNDHLLSALSDLAAGFYDGALIGATSAKDQRDLANYVTTVPIVMINRESTRFSSVTIDPQAVAQIAIALLISNGISAFTIVSTTTYIASSQRIQAITNLAIASQLEIKQRYSCSNTLAAGAKLASQIIADGIRGPIIVESDTVALGMLATFNRHNIKIPNDIQLISIGLLDPDTVTYATPSLSTIQLSSSDFSRACIALLQARLSGQPVSQRTVLPKLILRDSFPPNTNKRD